MATYKAISKTNHFHVTDVERLKDIVCRMQCSAKVNLVEDPQDTYVIWSDADILGVYPEDLEGEISGPDFELMTSELQAILPEGEALILFEIGTESLRYIVATATIVTKNTIRQINLLDEALDAVRSILNDSDWDTQIDN